MEQLLVSNGSSGFDMSFSLSEPFNTCLLLTF